MYESNQTKCRSTEKGESRYSFRRIDVNPGEEQLVAVVVFSRPLSNHLSDISQVTNETWYQKINGGQERQWVNQTFNLHF